MPIKPGKDFISRCIREMSHKHPDWDHKRVVAACHSMQRQSDSRHIVMDERSAIDPSEVRMTNDGYLVTMPRIARTGIQIYAGHEVGRPDLDEVRVYRPAEEVFDEAAMHSYAHRPVTDDHPSEPVTASNWRKFAVGQTGAEVVRDGRFVRVPMVVMDSAAIKKVQNGKTQLSNSYACDLHWEDGVDEEGKPYDAVQRNIRGNHLAIVANARGGADLRIGDELKGDEAMATHIVDGVGVEMSDTAIQVVKRALADRDARLKALDEGFEQFKKKKKEEEEMEDRATKDAAAKHTTEIATKDAEIAKLQKALDDSKVTPAMLDQRVKDRAEMLAKAKAILGDALVVEGKTDDEIRRQVVLSHVGDAAKDWDAGQMQTSFISITAKMADAQPSFAPYVSGFDDAARTLGSPPASRVTSDQAYNERNQRLQDAWKKVASTPAA